MPENAGNPNILLVDNDGIVIEALADLFKRILPAVNIADSATSGVEALKLLTSNADQYALVLLDMSLEGMQGPEVCRRMRLADCSTPVLGMTSFSSEPVSRAASDGWRAGYCRQKRRDAAQTGLCPGSFRRLTIRFRNSNDSLRETEMRYSNGVHAHQHARNHHEPVRERISDGWRDIRTTRHIHRHRAQAHAKYRQTTELPYATASHHHMVET